MLKGLGNIAAMMKQAQEMQSRMGEMQEKLAAIRVEAETGGGMVRVEMTGQQRVTQVSIDPELIDGDREMLEDLLLAAVNQSLDKSREAAADQMKSLAGGLDVPGLNDALSKLGNLGGSV